MFSKDGQMLSSSDINGKVFPVLDYLQNNVLSLAPKGFVMSRSGLQLQRVFIHQGL